MTTYTDLGVRRIINVAATLTRLGGSRMPPPVIEAMVSASGAFVDLDTLQQRVGARIAELTHNPACYVSAGAAAGLTIAVAACLAGDDPAAIARFPHLESGKNEVVVHGTPGARGAASYPGWHAQLCSLIATRYVR